MGTTVKKMSVVQLTVLTAINMLGSGIVLLPSKLAQVGTISIFSWIVTALGSLALAYAFAKCGRFSRKPGGMGVTPNTPLVAPATSCPTTPMACRC